MSLWSRAVAGLRNMVRRRDDPVREYRWVSPDQPTGIVITPETALQISVVWACTMAVTNAIACCRWNVLVVDGQRRQLLPDDPLDYLLNVRPNPDMTAIAFKESLLIQALSWGNSYGEIVKTPRGRIAELWPLLSDRTVVRRRREKPWPVVYEHHQQDGATIELEPSQVFHLRGPGISGLMGDNLVARAAKSMSLFAAQERFASTYFGNNTILGGVLQHPKKLQPEAHTRLKTDWEDQHKGPYKANKPTILEDGLEWKPFTNDAEAAQLVDSRLAQVEEICRWYGVPPHKVQHLLRATFNNIEHLGIEFVRDALTPWAKRLEQEADYKLFTQRPPWRSTMLDMGWLSHGDAKSRFEAYKFGRDMGVYTVNDILVMEGKNTIGKEGDVRIVPLNMTTLERMMQSPPDPGGGDKPGHEKPPAEDGKAGQADEPSPEDQPGADSNSLGNSIARDALVTVFASVFERYTKRLQKREADLRRRGAADAKIAAHLRELREELRTWLIEESAAGLEMLAKVAPGQKEGREAGLLLAVDEVDNGRAPALAAQDLVAGLWPETEKPKC